MNLPFSTRLTCKLGSNMISPVLMLANLFLIEAYFAIERVATEISNSTEDEVPLKILSSHIWRGYKSKVPLFTVQSNFEMAISVSKLQCITYSEIRLDVVWAGWAILSRSFCGRNYVQCQLQTRVGWNILSWKSFGETIIFVGWWWFSI